jgi:hypothetical protein
VKNWFNQFPFGNQLPLARQNTSAQLSALMRTHSSSLQFKRLFRTIFRLHANFSSLLSTLTIIVSVAFLCSRTYRSATLPSEYTSAESSLLVFNDAVWHSEVVYSALHAALLLRAKHIFVFDRSRQIEALNDELLRHGGPIIPFTLLRSFSDVSLTFRTSPVVRRHFAVLFITPEICSRNTQLLSVQAHLDSQISRMFWMCHNLANCVHCLKRTVPSSEKVTILVPTAKMRKFAVMLLPSADVSVFTPLLPTITNVGRGLYSGDVLRVLVPGSVNFSKRNYESLLPLGGQGSCLRRLHIHIFGKCLSTAQCRHLKAISAHLQQRAITVSHSSHFRTDTFATYASLHQAVQWADIIAPCIDETVRMCKQYINGKMSASVIMALSYRKTLLIWSNLSTAYGLSNQVVYSSSSSLISTLCTIRLSRAQLSRSRDELTNASKVGWNEAIVAMARRLR